MFILLKETSGYCHLLGHSHIDAAWLWPLRETEEVCKNTFESVLRQMDKYPGFCFAQSSALYYKWMEENHPDIFREIKRRVEGGRWEVVGGMWVEPDCNIPSGESLVRQVIHGKRYFREKLCCDVEIAWLVDSFGFPWTLPQILSKAGLRFFVTQKLRWNDATIFPHNVFIWRSPDGSSVLSHQTVGSYNEELNREEIDRQFLTIRRRHAIGDLLILYGKGDHGGGIPEETLRKSVEITKGNASIKGRYSTAREYFALLEAQPAGPWPEVNDELYLQYHRGTYTTQAWMKKANRDCEMLLEAAEKFCTIAQISGHTYPKEKLDNCWETLLLNQFHDIISGSSIPEVYEDAAEDLSKIKKTADALVSEAVRAIAADVDTSGEGASILVFNPLSWKRDSLIQITLEGVHRDKLPSVRDSDGQMVHHQVVEGGKKLIFIVRGVPPLGYKEYKLVSEKKQTQGATDLKVEKTEDRTILENEYLEVHVDMRTGLIVKAYDKVNRREFLNGEANVIQVFKDQPTWGRSSIVTGYDAAIFDAWETYIFQQPEGVMHDNLNEPSVVEVVEEGPVRCIIKVEYVYQQEGRQDSMFTQEIMLLQGVPLLEFRLHINWCGEHRLAKVAFPLNVRSDFTSYEAPYGYVVRCNPNSPHASLEERAKYEVPGQKWIDHTDDEETYGVSLLNNARYGFDTVNDTMRMTLLRSPSYPSMEALEAASRGLPAPKAEPTDQGEHEVTYALYPHMGSHKEAMTAKRGYEFNYPLILYMGASSKGRLQKVFSFISVEPDNIIMTVAKKAEDSDDVILRLYETDGKKVTASIQLLEAPIECWRTNLMEEKEGELQIKGDTIRVSVAEYEIKTLRLSFSEDRESQVCNTPS